MCGTDSRDASGCFGSSEPEPSFERRGRIANGSQLVDMKAASDDGEESIINSVSALKKKHETNSLKHANQFNCNYLHMWRSNGRGRGVQPLINSRSYELISNKPKINRKKVLKVKILTTF